ncbi:hypothetical protein [Nocardiopsis oceani]
MAESTEATGRSVPVRALLWSTAGILALVLAAGLAVSVAYPGTVHRVADTDRGDPPSYPFDVREQGWDWQPPRGTSVTGVGSGPHGPVMELSDGFTALDGTTGEELWTYRKPRTDGLETRLFEGAALLVHRPGDGPSTETLLDPGTGEITAERPAAEQGVLAYTLPTALHEYRNGAGRQGFEAREADSGDPRWAFVPEADDLLCEYQPHPWPTYAPDTGAGRVVVAQACVDAQEYEEGTLTGSADAPGPGGVEDILVYGGQLDSMAAVVSAMDLDTGEELWRHEQPVTEPADRIELDRVSGTPSEFGAEHAFRLMDHDGQVLLDPGTGEPLDRPEEALDEDGLPRPDAEWVLRADADGTVLAVPTEGADGEFAAGEREAFEVLTADADGDVRARLTIDEEGVHSGHFAHAAVLEDTLLVPRVDPQPDAEGGVVSVLVASLAADDLGGAWLEVGPASSGAEEGYRLLPVPGAVVSYTTDGDGSVVDIRALVP